MHDSLPQFQRTSERDAEVDAALRFLLVSGIGLGRLRQLRLAFGCFADALSRSARDVAETLRIADDEAGRMLAEARAGGERAEAERSHAARAGARILLLSDDSYPELLKASPDPPELLIVRGELPAEPEPAVAIVGSRRATAYGSLQAASLALELAERGVTVVSGGARGIDGEAHRAALRAGGRTVAVLATGLAQPYPPEHAPLFESIVEGGGALVTEQPSFVAARPELFPRRNRVIAALSLVTIVVEAASRSGALLTARIAVDDLSRDAGCVPGPVTSVMSAGCHRAIREGWASLVTSADDVVELLSASRTLVSGAHEEALRRRTAPPSPARAGQPRPRRRGEADAPPPSGGSCSSDAQGLLEAISRLGSAGFDELERALSWEIPRIATAALELEMSGRIERGTDGAFRARSRKGAAKAS